MSTPEQALLITDEDTKPNGAAMTLSNPTQLLSYVVQNAQHLPPGEALSIIERIVAMKERADDKKAEREFNDALELAQKEMPEIVPDCINNQTHKPYPSYRALNRQVRPVYSKHGFTLSFNAAPSDKADEVLILCRMSHSGGHTATYTIPFPCDGQGAKGGGALSKSHAMIAASSYGRSTLMKMIFNLDIGDMIESAPWLQNHLDEIARCETLQGLESAFNAGLKEAREKSDQSAMVAVIAAKDERKRKIK